MTAVDRNIYASYNNYSSVYATGDLDHDEFFRENLKSGYNFRPIVSCFYKSLCIKLQSF